ncbi:hypothetical protein J2T09_000717 [Neorhizobium huautlense]|uniref:Uncharacterized protein n=1 Tax=Neorhizobium huautlense TaxID=67774 RepID=A0ABT9PNG0_9HYPH|nr:hypothetical protein [Neorhizobium huautlense]MDP9835975.1 hypothetical protein [Neorhizobium huautlense]
MNQPDLEYKRSQYDVAWDFMVFGGPRQDSRLNYRIEDFKEWVNANFTLTSWGYLDRSILPFPQYTFTLLHSHPNHLKLPVPYESEEIEIEGLAYDDLKKGLEFEVATPRFIGGFVRKFQERFPENTDIIIGIHTLTFSRFNASLSEDEAMNNMLTDDLNLMRELGMIE